jgi:phage terminase small subunit
MGAENLRKPQIATYIAQKNKAVLSTLEADARERREWLTDIMRNRRELTSDRIKACDTLNKMTGEYVLNINDQTTHDDALVLEVEQYLFGADLVRPLLEATNE